MIGVLFLSVALLKAQLPTATILGVVKDSTGAVVPRATLTARHLETGQTRTAVSGQDGSYRLLALPVGNYQVRVEHTGFRTQVRSSLLLSVAQEAVVNFSLEIGAIEQSISVTAEPSLVNTTSGSLGGLVNEERMSELPLNGRNYADLTLLQPGIQQHRNLGATTSSVGMWFSSNGAPVRSNNYLLDGAIMQNLVGTTASSVSGATLGMEGIREYRVVTNSFSAEYGLTMGSQTTMVTKSGTNTFHGSAFEYLRNSALDARNFFDRNTLASPRRLPAFTRNHFGGSAGGPLRKDKAFFFGVYEGLRERLGRTMVSQTIPPAAKVEGGLVLAIAPVIKPLLTLYPDPNLPNNQFTFPFSQPTREDYGQGRLDYNISTHDTVFARYTLEDSEQSVPQLFPGFETVGTSRLQYATLAENHVFSSSLLNMFRFSFSRTESFFDTPTRFSGPQFSFIPGLGIGVIRVGGVSDQGPSLVTPNEKRQNIFTWSDDLFSTRGRHALKFGTLLNRYQQFVLSGNAFRGSVNFADLRSFLLAQPTLYSAVTPGSIQDRTYDYNTLGFYFQDDLRVRSNFTLNLGLRYEFTTEYRETKNRGAALRDVLQDASTTIGPPFRNPSLHNFSPRFGFAWDIRGNGKAAVRGGFGLLYDIGNLGSILVLAVGTPPFSTVSTVSSPPSFTLPFFFPPEARGKSLRTLDYNFAQPHLLQYNLTVERQLPWGAVATLSYVGSRGIHLPNTTEGNPTVPQVRPDGRKFWTGRDPRLNPNWGTIEFHTAASSSWYNAFQFGLNKRWGKRLQFQSSYSFSKTLDETQDQLTNSDNSTNKPQPSDPGNLRAEKSPAAFDVPQSWRLNAIYHLPELAPGAWLSKLANGWRMSGILSVQSGYPFTPVLLSNRSRSGVDGGALGVDRPDLKPGHSKQNIILGGPDRYYDPTAFELQPLGFLGNAGRNILRGPGFAALDLGLGKDAPLHFLGEGGKLEFRVEFFNLLNRANFATPALAGANNAAIVFAGRTDREAPLPTAGKITSTASTSRQIQLALKILF